jgi:hypothetical protein
MNFEYNINHEQFSKEASADVIVVNNEIFTYKNSGLTRRVFVNESKTKVIKVPVKLDTYHFNKEEIECWENADEETRLELATTKILENGYIEQEYLHTLDDPDTEEWLGRPMTQKEIRFASSCRNDVGYDSEGNLKCFDLHEYKQY